MSTNTSESLVRGEMVVRTPEGIALKIMQSEAMMWLMVGANHPDLWIRDLRPGWDAYVAAGDKTQGRPSGTPGAAGGAEHMSASGADIEGWLTEQRQGIGTQMLLYRIGLCREHDCRRVLLDVATENVNAIRLYERLGFSICGQDPDYFAAGEGAYFMVLELTNRIRSGAHGR